MNILFWGLTIGMIGKVMVATGVIFAHSGIVQEKRIDAKVLNYFKIERELTILGLILILAGYFLEIYFFGFTPLLTCTPEECGHAASVILSQ